MPNKEKFTGNEMPEEQKIELSKSYVGEIKKYEKEKESEQAQTEAFLARTKKAAEASGKEELKKEAESLKVESVSAWSKFKNKMKSIFGGEKEKIDEPAEVKKIKEPLLELLNNLKKNYGIRSEIDGDGNVIIKDGDKYEKALDENEEDFKKMTTKINELEIALLEITKPALVSPGRYTTTYEKGGIAGVGNLPQAARTPVARRSERYRNAKKIEKETDVSETEQAPKKKTLVEIAEEDFAKIKKEKIGVKNELWNLKTAAARLSDKENFPQFEKIFDFKNFKKDIKVIDELLESKTTESAKFARIKLDELKRTLSDYLKKEKEALEKTNKNFPDNDKYLAQKAILKNKIKAREEILEKL
ncbi:MAG: hypothetical protein WC430_01720 [Patescibacteria group bacterium]